MTATATIGYHSPLGHGGGIAVAIRNQRSTRGLDGPDFHSPHNNFSDVNQLVHATLPIDAYNSFNATLTHNHATFQIPNYVSSGQPAASDDDETQEDSSANFQFRHTFGDSGLLTFGPAVKISRIHEFGDPRNATYTVVDSNSNSGSTYEAYAQDTWRIGNAWQVDYGLRYDHFSISSTSFANAYTQFSPRASAYKYFGLFFTPFSFENVDPGAAQQLNLPNQRTLAQFELRPFRRRVRQRSVVGIGHDAALTLRVRICSTTATR